MATTQTFSKSRTTSSLMLWMAVSRACIAHCSPCLLWPTPTPTPPLVDRVTYKRVATTPFSCVGNEVCMNMLI